MDERKNIQPEEFQDQDFLDTFGDAAEFQKVFEQGEPAPGAPFGTGPKEVLDTVHAICEKFPMYK